MAPAVAEASAVAGSGSRTCIGNGSVKRINTRTRWPGVVSPVCRLPVLIPAITLLLDSAQF